MQRWALRVAAGLLLLSAGVCAWIWNVRRSLLYNDQGRYFDTTNAVVLHEQAVTVYGLLALVLAVIAGICALASRRS